MNQPVPCQPQAALEKELGELKTELEATVKLLGVAALQRGGLAMDRCGLIFLVADGLVI